MSHPITDRFQDCIIYLKSSGAYNSYRQIAHALDMHPQCLSDILKSKREVTLQILQEAITVFNCNPLFLHHGTGDMFVIPDHLRKRSENIYTKITYVSEAAQAGYVDQMLDPIFIEDLPSFTIPDKQYVRGDYRCFDIEGDSMEPTLYENDKVICRVIDSSLWFSNIRRNFVYVFVTKAGIMIKRVQEINKDEQSFTLASDNEYYEAFDLQLSEVYEISTLITRVNHFRPQQIHVHKKKEQEIKTLKETIAHQSQLIKQLNEQYS